MIPSWCRSYHLSINRTNSTLPHPHPLPPPLLLSLQGLTEDDLYKILTEPVTNLIRQQKELLATENLTLQVCISVGVRVTAYVHVSVSVPLTPLTLTLTLTHTPNKGK